MEIKFRVWGSVQNAYIDNKKCFVLTQDGKILALGGVGFNPEDGMVPEFSTGILDKNEAEIYQGDIIKFSYTSEFRSYEFIGVVERDTCNPCFVIINPKNHDQIEFDWVSCGSATLEKLGDVHTAPEALKWK